MESSTASAQASAADLANTRLSLEAELAVRSARDSVRLTTNQYDVGIVSYLNVVVVNATALANERTAVDVEGPRLAASVLLIKALGGGWSADALPSSATLARR